MQLLPPRLKQLPLFGFEHQQSFTIYNAMRYTPLLSMLLLLFTFSFLQAFGAPTVEARQRYAECGDSCLYDVPAGQSLTNKNDGKSHNTYQHPIRRAIVRLGCQ